jgi:hypothetical protein
VILNEEAVRLLVSEEARRLKLSWMAVDPLVAIIKRQWVNHGNWDFFGVDSIRIRLLEEPRAVTTQCLFDCLEKIKKNESRFLSVFISIAEEKKDELQHEEQGPKAAQ